MQNNSDHLKDTFQLEIQLVKVFGYNILNYIKILHPNTNISIKLPALTKSSNILINDYIKAISQLFKAIKYPFTFATNSLTKQFLEVSQELYLTRYVQSKILFAQYGYNILEYKK